MCRIFSLLAFVVISMNYVNSWDIAITAGNQLELYTNGTKEDKKDIRLTELTALAYDAVHNILLFVDKQSDNASIFGYHLLKNKFQPLVRRRMSDNIQGLAFDPVNDFLFWTDSNDRSIMKTSLLSGTTSNAYGNLLLKTDKEIPRALAVDSCRGYLYWTNIYTQNATIERMRFDGSERTVIISDDIFMPTSIAIDQREKKIFWSDDKPGIHYSIESSDLDGKNRKKLYSGQDHVPNALTISKDSIYWTDWGFKSVWQYPKKPSSANEEPKNMTHYKNMDPFGIVANYNIQDQIHGIPECEELERLSRNKTALNESFKEVTRNEGLFCLHGQKVEGKWACNCTPGYAGERCEVSVCRNFCYNGDCVVSSDSKPSCNCTVGFTGDRCEINYCHDFCLNNGVCSFNLELNEPSCACKSDYDGKRCELVKAVKLIHSEGKVDDQCNCTKDGRESDKVMPKSVKAESVENEALSLSSDEGLFVDTTDGCSAGWDPLRDPIIMVLGSFCGLLFVGCAVLITKVMHLRRRPRIKKRIIVNKNVTPLTNRPDQCEITIENCCNMNICETPCFEPRTIRPGLMDSKPGKEERKNLIGNMELQDDMY